MTPAASLTICSASPPTVSGNSSVERPPISVSASVAVVEALEVAAQLVDEAEADLVRHDLVVEDPLLALGHRHGLGEQVVHLDDVDAAVAHLGDEVEVVALGVFDPEHVVEQQPVAVGGREALVCASGAQTITLRSWPTSEWTPNLTSFVLAMIGLTR